MSKDIKPCPFCGAEVSVQKIPLWQGSHGYQGCYQFDISCKCGATTEYENNDSIYRSEEEAERNVINKWNQRADSKENTDIDYKKVEKKAVDLVAKGLNMLGIEVDTIYGNDYEACENILKGCQIYLGTR